MRAIIFDTETTGLLKKKAAPLNTQPSVIEFYGCAVDHTGEVIDVYETLIKPPEKIAPIITQITGITNEMLEDAPPFSFVAPKIKKFLEGGERVVAHNLSFDVGMIDNEFERLTQALAWPKVRTCTVEQLEFIKGHRMKLADLYNYFFPGETYGAHRAKADVVALTRIYRECLVRNWL
jgi:DNA polymerase III epsilon subunit family exonuclease